MHSPTTSPTGTPPSRRRRVLDTIDYELLNYFSLIYLVVKFDKEPIRKHVCR